MFKRILLFISMHVRTSIKSFKCEVGVVKNAHSGRLCEAASAIVTPYTVYAIFCVLLIWHDMTLRKDKFGGFWPLKPSQLHKLRGWPNVSDLFPIFFWFLVLRWRQSLLRFQAWARSRRSKVLRSPLSGMPLGWKAPRCDWPGEMQAYETLAGDLAFAKHWSLKMYFVILK